MSCPEGSGEKPEKLSRDLSLFVQRKPAANELQRLQRFSFPVLFNMWKGELATVESIRNYSMIGPIAII